MYAWGIRNPYGVNLSPDEVLYATENGFDVRGSRPIGNDREDLYVIKQGAWYGWAASLAMDLQFLAAPSALIGDLLQGCAEPV